MTTKIFDFKFKCRLKPGAKKELKSFFKKVGIIFGALLSLYLLGLGVHNLAPSETLVITDAGFIIQALGTVIQGLLTTGFLFIVFIIGFLIFIILEDFYYKITSMFECKED